MANQKALEELCVRMVSSTNEARICYLKSMQAARAQEMCAAADLLARGDEQYAVAHAVHVQLLQMEAGGTLDHVSLLILHAEDQLVSAETYKALAVEAGHIYQILADK